MSKEKEEQDHKDLIAYTFKELANAINDAKSGKPPTKSYDKLKEVYNSLSLAEKKRSNNEISDLEMQKELADQVEKLKKEI